MYSSLRSFLSRKSILSVIGILVAFLNNGSVENGVFSEHGLNSRFSRILSSAKLGSEYDVLDLNMPSVVSVFSLGKEEMMSLLKEVYGQTKKANLSDEEKIIRDIKKYRISCNYSAIPYAEEFGVVVYNKTDKELDADLEGLNELSETFRDDAYNHWVRVMKNEENKYFETFDDLSTYYDKLKEENLILDNYKDQKINECITAVQTKAQKLLPGLTKIFEDWAKDQTLYKNEFETLICSVRIAWRALTNYTLYECKKIFVRNLDEVEKAEEEKKSKKKEEKTNENEKEEKTSEQKKEESNTKKNLRKKPQNGGDNFDEFLDMKEADEIVQDVLQEFVEGKSSEDENKEKYGEKLDDYDDDDEDDYDDDEDDDDDEDADDDEKGVFKIKKDETATIKKDIEELEEFVSVEDITNIALKITTNEKNKVSMLKKELSDFHRKQCEKHNVKVEGSRGVLKSCYNMITNEFEKLQGSLNKSFLSILMANVLSKKDAEKYFDKCFNTHDDFRKKMKETCEQKIIKYFNYED
ncbi:Plasmodium exported protein (PHISTb), unknown function [Plasmodium sp. DRC-Itaito]|nr:Plasmodium exported protein (PHISTb), unknown function [Plasmodium sp. DRC-Itaito]